MIDARERARVATMQGVDFLTAIARRMAVGDALQIPKAGPEKVV